MSTEPSPQDIFDTDKRTGALVLGSNRLDDYARKYLSSHCKEALTSPMALPINRIIEQEGLRVIHEKLSFNGDIFGCCVLLDSDVPVIDQEAYEVVHKHFKAGTILIDPDSEFRFNEGTQRNTLMHEALHWEKDRAFFKMKAMRDAQSQTPTNPILCRSSKTFFTPSGKKTLDNQINWLEWQAHRLTPRILMPEDTFRKKGMELLEDSERYQTCDSIVQALSDFFIVSRMSTKYRIQEVGLDKNLSVFPDYEDVFSDLLNENNYTELTPIEADQLLSDDSTLAAWVDSNNYIFADGYFVLADSEFIERDGAILHLTKKAWRNLSKCALNIRSFAVRKYASYKKDLVGGAFLYRTTDVDNRILVFHPSFQPECPCDPDEAYQAYTSQLFDIEDDMDFQELLASPSSSLCRCLWYLIEKRGLQYPEKFAEATLLHTNYCGNIRNDKSNNMANDTLMAICVGLGIGLRTVQKLYGKSKNRLDEFNDPDKTRLKIIERTPGLPISDFNSILVSRGLEELGTKLRD